MRLIVFVLISVSVVFATNPTARFFADDYHVEIGEEVEISFLKNNVSLLKTRHTSSLFKANGAFSRCEFGDNPQNLCLQWGGRVINITLSPREDNANCVQVDDNQPADENGEIAACYPYGEAQWFGGAERWFQDWPVQTTNIDNKPFLTGYDSSQSVAEPLWFNSDGMSMHVNQDTPLFVDSNQRGKGVICLIAKNGDPYYNRDSLSLRYEVCPNANAVEAQRNAVQRYFGKPTGRPSDVMFRDPIYSTWVRYGRDIDQNKMIGLVEELKKNNFPIGQVEIDDRWEPCYGASEFDTSRFPDIKNFTNYVHSLGGRVTAWIYPFINNDCNPHYDDAQNAGRFIKDDNGNTAMNWWCGDGGAIDVTNSDTARWFTDRLKNLQQQSGLDSFKFDAGETNYLPSHPQLSGDSKLFPNIYVAKYVEAVSAFSGLMEVRVGRDTQKYPVAVRMLDKDTRWGLDNGLQSVVTSLFQMNLAGYPFVLPDMIGGNQYNEPVSKELFIRWLQASVFMPVLQFSVLPWDFDSETVEISRKYLDLHSNFAPNIQQAADRAVADGTPVNTPIWWIAPDDQDALKCRDEYLLGDNILVAPVLDEGRTSRDIYLPAGKWFNERVGQVNGPTWLRNFDAPLNTLPYFIKQ